MFIRRAHVLVPTVVAALVLINAGAVRAQLTDAQQKCTDTMTKDLAKTVKTASKDIAGCVKDYGKGKLTTGLATCLAADRKEKLAKTAAKVVGDFDKKCAGNDKEGAPQLPAFGAVSAAATTSGGETAASGLLTDVFGADPDAAFATGAATDRIKCQTSVLKAAQKCVDTRAKEFRGCAKTAVGDDGAASAGALADACLGTGTAGQTDEKGKIAKTCDDPVKPDKLRKTIDKKCVAAGIDLAADFPGCAEGTLEDLHACIDASAACHVCRAANASAGLTRNCDLLDDGLNNGSCAVCGNGIAEAGEVCDGGDDAACPGTCLSLCACPGPRDFTMMGNESTVDITGFGNGILFPMDATISLDVTGELVPGAPTFDIAVQGLPPSTSQILGADQTLCVFFEQGAGLDPGIAGTGVINCTAADVTGLTTLDSPNIQEYYDHCANGLPASCDSAPNPGGGKLDETTGVFVPDGPVDATCTSPLFNPDTNPDHSGNCIYGPDESAGPGAFRRGDATFTVRAILELRPGIDACGGGPSPGAPEAVLEFTTGRAQTGIMDLNGAAGDIGSLIAFGTPFDCQAFLGADDPAGATFVGAFPVLDLSLGFGIFRDLFVEATLVGR